MQMQMRRQIEAGPYLFMAISRWIGESPFGALSLSTAAPIASDGCIEGCLGLEILGTSSIARHGPRTTFVQTYYPLFQNLCRYHKALTSLLAPFNTLGKRPEVVHGREGCFFTGMGSTDIEQLVRISISHISSKLTLTLGRLSGKSNMTGLFRNFSTSKV